MVKVGIAVLLGGLAMGCSAGALPDHYELRLDPTLTGIQSELVLDAATDWSLRTGKRITFTPVVSSEHCDYNTHIGCIHVEYVSHDAVQVVSHNIQGDNNHNYIGCTTGNGTASNIVVQSLDTTAKEYRNLLHEEGHSLGSSHLAKNNIMAPNFEDESATLTDADVGQVLRLHNLPVE
jgi:hypothetical protein